MPRMTAADAAVAILRREGVTDVFGLPGAAISMGTELDNVTEFEDLAGRREDAPTAVVALLD
jgi:glyoxylate carboligase